MAEIVVWLSTIIHKINSGLGLNLVDACQARESRVFV